MNHVGEITGWLHELRKGSDTALNNLFPLVYNQLRAIAYNQLRELPPGHTLSKTEIVHEVYLKMARQVDMSWKDRANFFAVASKAMRHILIDHIRKKKAGKRGGNHSEVTLIDEIISTEHSAEDELVQIDHALDELAKFDDRMAKIVEYRYFGDMKMSDIAEVLNLSPRTVKRDWAVARGWLYQRLKEEI